MAVPANSCWMWAGAYFSNGYGQAWWTGHGRPIQAHRLMFLEAVGPIPSDKQIDHLCRVRGCVNPAHLRLASRENIMAPGARCRAKVNAGRTHCPKGHSYEGRNLYVAHGKRYCRTCKNAGKVARRRARRISAQGTIPPHDAGSSVGTIGAVIAGTSPNVNQCLGRQEPNTTTHSEHRS